MLFRGFRRLPQHRLVVLLCLLCILLGGDLSSLLDSAPRFAARDTPLARPQHAAMLVAALPSYSRPSSPVNTPPLDTQTRSKDELALITPSRRRFGMLDWRNRRSSSSNDELAERESQLSSNRRSSRTSLHDTVLFPELFDFNRQTLRLPRSAKIHPTSFETAPRMSTEETEGKARAEGSLATAPDLFDKEMYAPEHAIRRWNQPPSSQTLALMAAEEEEAKVYRVPFRQRERAALRASLQAETPVKAFDIDPKAADWLLQCIAWSCLWAFKAPYKPVPARLLRETIAEQADSWGQTELMPTLKRMLTYENSKLLDYLLGEWQFDPPDSEWARSETSEGADGTPLEGDALFGMTPRAYIDTFDRALTDREFVDQEMDLYIPPPSRREGNLHFDPIAIGLSRLLLPSVVREDVRSFEIYLAYINTESMPDINDSAIWQGIYDYVLLSAPEPEVEKKMFSLIDKFKPSSVVLLRSMPPDVQEVICDLFNTDSVDVLNLASVERWVRNIRRKAIKLTSALTRMSKPEEAEAFVTSQFLRLAPFLTMEHRFLLLDARRFVECVKPYNGPPETRDFYMKGFLWLLRRIVLEEIALPCLSIRSEHFVEESSDEQRERREDLRHILTFFAEGPQADENVSDPFISAYTLPAIASLAIRKGHKYLINLLKEPQFSKLAFARHYDVPIRASCDDPLFSDMLRNRKHDVVADTIVANNVELFKWLLDYDTKRFSTNFYNILHLAGRANRPEMIKIMQEAIDSHKIEINAEDLDVPQEYRENGHILPLYIQACLYGHAKCVRPLLQIDKFLKEDILLFEPHAYEPIVFHLAAMDYDTLRALLDSLSAYPEIFRSHDSARHFLRYINIKDDFKLTALACAAVLGRHPQMRHLLNLGAATNVVSSDNLSILHTLGKTRTPCDVPITDDAMAIQAELLVRSGAPMNTQDTKDKSTALDWFIRNKWRKTARALIGLGADPFIANKMGETPLFKAVKAKDLRMMYSLGRMTGEALRRADPRVTAAMVFGIRCPHTDKTLLHVALENCDYRMAQVLVDLAPTVLRDMALYEPSFLQDMMDRLQKKIEAMPAEPKTAELKVVQDARFFFDRYLRRPDPEEQ